MTFYVNRCIIISNKENFFIANLKKIIFKGDFKMANYWLDNGMALMRQREINDANRYGTPNGSFQIAGTVTEYRDGKQVSHWNSSNDSIVSTKNPYMGWYK